MKRPIWESEWHGLKFKDISVSTSMFSRAGSDFYDELYQPNAIDKNGIPQQKCDESWSLDNLRVRVVKYQ